MLTGESLFHRDARSNLARATDYALLAEWPSALKADTLGRVADPSARALLRVALTRDPARRPADMAAVLGHPYLIADSNTAAAAPRLRKGEAYHALLLSAGPMLPSAGADGSSGGGDGEGGGREWALEVKGALEAAAPGCKIEIEEARHLPALPTSAAHFDTHRRTCTASRFSLFVLLQLQAQAGPFLVIS